MPQVPPAAVKARASRLRQRGAAALASHLRSQVGREVDVLMERERLGRTPQFAEVGIARAARAGEIVRARITAAGARRLEGELAASGAPS
jgi:threonylcarbamoyladenosine tRNA methylthiotransferase MtaB